MKQDSVLELLNTGVQSLADFAVRFLKTLGYLTLRPHRLIYEHDRWVRRGSILTSNALLFSSSYALSASLLVYPAGLQFYAYEGRFGHFVLNDASEQFYRHLLNSDANVDFLTLVLCGAPIIICIDLIGRFVARVGFSGLAIERRRVIRNLVVYALSYHAILLSVSLLSPSVIWLVVSDGQTDSVFWISALLLRTAFFAVGIFVPLIVIGSALLRYSSFRKNLYRSGLSFVRGLVTFSIGMTPFVLIVAASGTSLNKADARWANEPFGIYEVGRPSFLMHAYLSREQWGVEGLEPLENSGFITVFLANKSPSPILLETGNMYFELNIGQQRYVHWDAMYRERGTTCPPDLISVPGNSGVLLEVIFRERIPQSIPATGGLPSEGIFEAHKNWAIPAKYGLDFSAATEPHFIDLMDKNVTLLDWISPEEIQDQHDRLEIFDKCRDLGGGSEN